MPEKSQRIVAYFISGIGLALILFAYPLSFALLLYDYKVRAVFQSFGIAFEPRNLLPLPLTLFLGLLGLCLWLSQRGPLKADRSADEQIDRGPVKAQKLYCYWVLTFVVISTLGGIGIFVAFLLMFLLAYSLGSYPPHFPQDYGFFISMLTGFGSAFVQLGMAFLIGRFHWRWLYKLPATRPRLDAPTLGTN